MYKSAARILALRDAIFFRLRSKMGAADIRDLADRIELWDGSLGGAFVTHIVLELALHAT